MTRVSNQLSISDSPTSVASLGLLLFQLRYYAFGFLFIRCWHLTVILKQTHLVLDGLVQGKFSSFVRDIIFWQTHQAVWFNCYSLQKCNEQQMFLAFITENCKWYSTLSLHPTKGTIQKYCDHSSSQAQAKWRWTVHADYQRTTSKSRQHLRNSSTNTHPSTAEGPTQHLQEIWWQEVEILLVLSDMHTYNHESTV